MTSRPWTFRAAAIGVALAAASATFATFAVAEAGTMARPAAENRHDPAPAGQREHDLDGPLSKTQDAQRQEALNQLIAGKATAKERNGSKVVQLKSKQGDSKYVELSREKTDKIFTILVEFGDQTDPKFGGTPGPLHNKIAAPDRKKDNSTAWQADYNQKHYQDLYFGTGAKTESLKKYYEKQSSGRYSVEGEVSDWVKVPYNEARYGNNACGQTNCTSVWNVVGDGLKSWVAGQKAAGKSDAAIKADLAQYDQWDRYDYDGDGDFNEPDGYVDHFQIVHAGEDESAGGGALGSENRSIRRARTPSGPTAGTRSAPTRARPARPATSSAAPRSATPASGSATTPSSRRTADSASSPTSTAMTSVCRTSTTPPAATTPPVSGP